MKEVPVKIEHNKQWIVVKLGIGEDRLVIPAPVNREILFKTVLDVAERKNILIVTTKTDVEAVYKILSVEKVLAVLKNSSLLPAMPTGSWHTSCPRLSGAAS
jgi:hypothetical protein